MRRDAGPTDRAIAATLTSLALLAGGVGVVLLVGWNWDRIPRSAQLASVFGGTTILFAGAAVAESRGRRRLAGRLVFLSSIVAASMFVGVDDAYHAAAAGISVYWALTACVVAALVPGTAVTLLAAAVTGAWIVQQGGLASPPWPFLALAPLLAIAVEQAPNRFAAGAVCSVVVLWAWAIANETWWNALEPAMVTALLAAAAIDAWAHAPASRRPAFARATPAAFYTLVSLLFLQFGHQRVITAPFDDLMANLWPALAAAGGLALVACSGLVSRSPGAWRAAGLAVLGVAWLGAWLRDPSLISSPAARWPWAAAFGLTAVLAGVSLVREAARDRDLGLFVMGVLNVIGFVVVRAIDANGNVWQSAGALFAGALLLVWLGRTWAGGRQAARS